MLIMGYCGGPDPAHPASDPVDDYRIVNSPFHYHDSAAVLLDDGRVVAAIEEERLNRIKHTHSFPAGAIEFCLSSQGLDLADIDQFVYYAREDLCNWAVGTYMLQNPWVRPFWSGKALLGEMFRRSFGREIAPEKLAFVEHHTAHAMSASAMAPFDSSLVVTLDGYGDRLSGTVFEGRGARLKRIASIPDSHSIGSFYIQVIWFLGYREYDEYKVMGLAPYGDPARYRRLFQDMYTLGPNGRFEIHPRKIAALMTIGGPRRQGEPFTREHKDIAAALQEATEEIVFHHLRHYRETTGLERLCFSGGVAHNCTLNGKILRSGLFDEVFVQPASHDAGCALGAALYAYHEACPEGGTEALTHLFWGSETGGEPAIRAELERWGRFVEFRRLSHRAEAVARLLADGAVIGWVQGRSEFGPRALGNRSILADPRPAENKHVVNAMVKKREGYRPFAPAVMEEYVEQYYDVPAGSRMPYMIFVVPVNKEVQPLLGAVTHVDGTARIQTVSKKTNPEFWELLDQFRALTGVPILLNTSFNNNKEPIVDSVADAVQCFLTTGLTHLVVGDFLVEKRPESLPASLDLVLSLPPHVLAARSRQFVPELGWSDLYTLTNTAFNDHDFHISKTVYELLGRADGRRPLRQLMAEVELSADDVDAAVREVRDLWSQRLAVLRPSADGALELRC